jgi:hypothetical protein
MKIIKLAILFIFIFAIVSCSSSEEPKNTNAVENTTVSSSETAAENLPNETSQPEEETFEMKEVYPVASYSQNTPTDTLKTFTKATINKDAEGVKKTLSKGSLKMIEESAKAQNLSVDSLLLTENENSLTEVPEMKNEKITGDTATVEVENKVTKSFDVMPLVKEDGEWKLALDKFTQDLMKKLREDMKSPPQKR